MAPIFIIGTERSGTNLLRLILNAHSHIAVPHPPHIMKFFSPIEPLYGDLTEDGNFRGLITDVCRLVELHTYPWEIRPDPRRVFQRARHRDLISIFFEIYDQYLEYSCKARWCCKSTFMIEHVAAILRLAPDARFIFMVRDGRDVAVSAKDSIFNHFHVYYSAQRWSREQRLGLDWMAQLSPEQIMLLRYEELIADPHSVVRSICTFLGEPFEEQMLEYHRSGEARKSGSLSISWKNTSRPVMSGNAAKFRERLTEREILLFEAIACRELDALGYPLTHPLPQLLELHAEKMRPKRSYRLAELSMRLKAEALHLMRDRNSLLRMKKLFFVNYLGAVRRLRSRHV